MKKLDENVSRRDFGKLTLAAFGGVVAGSMLGGKLLFADEKAMAKADAHACCGLNACKGQGHGGDNACAGQGGCATAEAHSCAGSNACKGQGETGDNACKGKGSCAVPVKGDKWKKARAHYEASMKKAGKKFGAAPAACGG
jgi:hypothetical protein